jgi:hypothetical protein
MGSNHEETGSSGISKLLIRRSATSQESRGNDLIRTVFVQKRRDGGLDKPGTHDQPEANRDVRLKHSGDRSHRLE